MHSQAIIFGSILLFFVLWGLFRQRIRYWVELLHERGWKSTIQYDHCLTLFKNLYTDINPVTVSLKERQEKGIIDDTSYIYGEIVFYSFVRILEQAQPKPGEIFYDLGSGGGKAVFIAGLVFDLTAYGIEKLTSLYQLSCELKEKLQKMPEFKNYFPSKTVNIEFINADFLEYDFSNGDLIFVNATCFRGIIFDQLIKKFLNLKVGSRIILVSADLDDIGGFEVIYKNDHLMSWGLNRVSIYKRI